jgi:hypothetical protein
VVLTVANRGLQGSGSYLPTRQAFYATDRAVEYSMNRDIIVNLTPGATINLMTNDVMSAGVPAGTKHSAIINASGGGTLSTGTVTDLGPNELPPSVAELYGSEFGANFYHVEVEATASGTAKSHVNASIVRLFKSDDDTIFRTSGGG